MRFFIRTVAWSRERQDNVARIQAQLPNLHVYVNETQCGYHSFFELCKAANETGGVLLEDDVELCQDFYSQISEIIAEKGSDKVFNFYERPQTYLETKYIGGSQFLWMQCIYLPPGLPLRILSHYEEFKRTQPQKWYGSATDCLIAYALTKEKTKYWRIRPCLVQHLPMKSVIGGPRQLDRSSPYYIEELRRKGVTYESLRPAQ